MDTGHYDVVIIGAGAAGLMCAMQAGKRGRRVWLIDHAVKIGEKIRISGGGRCNFTNLHAAPQAYLSQNPHFCKSALSRYTQHDFIALVKKHGIDFHEKKLGQLFCDQSAQQIIDMLLGECREVGVTPRMQATVIDIRSTTDGYVVETNAGPARCSSVVIATGGLSIPKIGATKFGYDVARRFGHSIIETRPGLVPLMFQSALLEHCKALSGVSVDATISCGKTSFSEGLLFTHRGLSGPSILQISSYWREGQEIDVNLWPDAAAFLKERKRSQPRQEIQTALSDILPRRLSESLVEMNGIEGRLADLSDKKIEQMGSAVSHWRIKPSGTEGYRTAEVTLGGVDTRELDSRTMESRKQKGLYFIGEVVDVTGHLGGYNFQWAWSSGHAAGQYV